LPGPKRGLGQNAVEPGHRLPASSGAGGGGFAFWHAAGQPDAIRTRQECKPPRTRQFEEQNQKAAEEAKEYGLPDLSGTEKQVAWATTIRQELGSTIRHNRARGTHQIRSMSEIVLELSKDGWTDDNICKKLGMELDEVIRLKQITGLREAFANHQFSKSWEEYEKRREERCLNL